MQIVINFSEIDLNDWIDFDGEYANAPQLKEVFKSEILYKFLERLNQDAAVRKYVKDNIDKGLANKIAAYKDDVAIKTIVEQIITQRIKDTGSFIFIDSYKSRVEEEVNKYLATYERKIDAAIRCSVQTVTEEIINGLYAASAMKEFIDIPKLTRHILKKIEGESKED